MRQATVKVERDPEPGADHEYGGWRVVVETPQVWAVQFRGDIAECEDMADEIRAGMNRK